MPLIIELNVSANMFSPLKDLLYFNLVILKLKCNNLIFNEILSLYASFVCLLHSRFVENQPIWILEDDPSFMRRFYHRAKLVILHSTNWLRQFSVGT
jgi:hypothetical protein